MFSIVTKKEGKKKGRRSNMKKNPKTTLFGHNFFLKKSAHPLFGAWSLLLDHVRFTPSHKPKSLKNAFSRNEAMKVLPWSVTVGKGPPTWDNFMVHDVNKARLAPTPPAKLTWFALPWPSCCRADGLVQALCFVGPLLTAHELMGSPPKSSIQVC